MHERAPPRSRVTRPLVRRPCAKTRTVTMARRKLHSEEAADRASSPTCSRGTLAEGFEACRSQGLAHQLGRTLLDPGAQGTIPPDLRIDLLRHGEVGEEVRLNLGDAARVGHGDVQLQVEIE